MYICLYKQLISINNYTQFEPKSNELSVPKIGH